MILIKYDENGNDVWNHIQAGEDFNHSAHVIDISTSSNGDLYFLGSEMGKTGFKRLVLGKMDNNGATKWQRRSNQNHHELPLNVKWVHDTLIYVNSAIQLGLNYAYRTRKYSQFTQDTSLVYLSDTIPVFRAKELIVRFKQSALNIPAIDNQLGKKTEYAPLDFYLNETALSEIDRVINGVCTNIKDEKNVCGITAVKIFKELTSDYKTTTSRMGETIMIPDFWTTLLISFPESVNLEQAYNALSDLDGYVAYVEVNSMIRPCTAPYPHDPEWGKQFSLESQLVYPDTVAIYMFGVWEMYDEGGSEHIKCGVFDQGINFKHEDFGYNESVGLSSTKVRGGWDMDSNNSLYVFGAIGNGDNGHGTPCAGIIGAIRNNNIGIAGIAGGKDDWINPTPYNDPEYFSNKGVSLYGMRIMKSVPEGDSTFFFESPIQYIYEAIVVSSIDDPTLDFGYGLHISSNSWRINEYLPGNWYTDTNYALLRDAIHFSNRAKVSYAAAIGNEKNDNPSIPARIDDDWILSVGGTGLEGDYKLSGPQAGHGSPIDYAPSFGNNIDVAAPSVTELVYTTSATGGYRSFAGTSAATPHVAGVVGLLMSYLNDVIPSYGNLSPEDCERIVELTANNYNLPGGYTDSVGWGKVNAGATMRFVEKPYSTVHHFGSNPQFTHNTSYQLENSNATIYLKEPVQDTNSQWYSKGFHDVNIYKIETTVYHEIDPIDTIVAFWARPSSSTVMEPVINDSLLPRERVYIDYLDRDSAVLHGYVYEMLDEFGVPHGWLPRDTTLNDELWLEYTVLSRDSTAPVVHTEEQALTNNIILYPNPSTDMHTIKIEGFASQNVFITLYDIQGRSLGTVYEGKLEDNSLLEFDVSNLSFGLYIYDVRLETERQTLRFLKY